MRRATLLFALVAIAGCKRAPAAAPDAGALDLPAAIAVRDDSKDLVLSYFAPDGGLVDVDSVAKVPAPARKHVLVRDLSKSAEQLHADRYLYVADLTERDADGGYAWSVVSRYGFEKKARELGAEAHLAAVTADGGAAVIIYGASWCGACHQAMAFLDQHGVAYVDKDIEKDPGAAAELEAKARAAGMRFDGIPVIDVGGELVLGFDATKLTRLLHLR